MGKAQRPAFCKSLTTKHIIRIHYECWTVRGTGAPDAFHKVAGAANSGHIHQFPYFKIRLKFKIKQQPWNQDRAYKQQEYLTWLGLRRLPAAVKSIPYLRNPECRNWENL